MPSLAARTMLLLVSVALTLGLLELMLASAGVSAVPVSIRANQGFDARAYHVFEDDNFEYDPVLIWKPRRSHAIFNSQGFRGPELTTPKPAGNLRIFAVGDSNTLGWAGADGSHWPGDLADLIAHVRPGVSVVNAGVWGYASYQGLRRLRQTFAFEPDIVLISFGSNDAHQVLRSDREYASAPIRETGLDRFVGRFRVGSLLLNALDRLPDAGAAELRPRVSLADYRSHLEQMVAEAHQRGVEIVLLTRPYFGDIGNPTWWKNWGDEYNLVTAAVAEDQHVMLIDVYSFFKDRDELFADESHFTDEGHRLAAAIIFDHIKPLVLGRTASGRPSS